MNPLRAPKIRSISARRSGINEGRGYTDYPSSPCRTSLSIGPDSINHHGQHQPPWTTHQRRISKKKVLSNRRGVLKRFDYFQTNGWVEAIEEKYYGQFREVCASYETVGNNISRRGVIDSTANRLDVLKELKVYN